MAGQGADPTSEPQTDNRPVIVADEAAYARYLGEARS